MDRFALTAQQRREVEGALKQCHEVPLYRRLLALLEVDQGRPVAAVAQALSVSRQSVYGWLRTYQGSGHLETLAEHPRSGRPTRWEEGLRELLRRWLAEAPDAHGYEATTWTVPLLQEQVRHVRGWPVGENTVRRQLHALGYTWKRARYVLEADPAWGKKMERIRHFLANLGPRSVILAEDETDLSLFPPLRSSWSPRGHPQEVLLSGKNDRRVLFGALSVRTGHRVSLVRERHRGEDFRAFLEVVHRHYRAWYVVVLLDEDSSHTAGESQLLAADYGLALIWLPKRSPHLNPMDHLWRHVKGVALANRQYVLIGDLVTHALNYLDSLSPRQTLRKAGVLSPDFWLKGIL